LWDTEFSQLFPNLEGKYHIFTANLDGTDLRHVSDDLGERSQIIDVSPDGEKALIVSDRPDATPNAVYILYIVNLIDENSEPIEVAELDEPASRLWVRGLVAKWIDNTRLIYIGQGESGIGIYTVYFDGTEQKTVYKPEVRYDTHIPYRILVVNESRIYWTAHVLLQKIGNRSWYEERIWWTNLDDLEYGKLEFNGQQLAGHISRWQSIALSPDGGNIAWYTQQPWGLYVASIADIDNPHLFEDIPDNFLDIAWVPNESRLLVYLDQSNLIELTVSTELIARKVDIFDGSERDCDNALYDVSPDGKLILLFPSNTGQARYMDMRTMIYKEILHGITFNSKCRHQINWIP